MCVCVYVCVHACASVWNWRYVKAGFQFKVNLFLGVLWKCVWESECVGALFLNLGNR